MRQRIFILAAFCAVFLPAQSALAWRYEAAFSEAIHAAFFGNTGRAARGTTVAVGLARHRNPNEPWVFYVATGAAQTGFPAQTTVLYQDIPAGTERLRAIRQIMQRVANNEGWANDILNRMRRAEIVVINARVGDAGGQTGVAHAPHPQQPSFGHVREIGLPLRPDHLHAEGAIVQAHHNARDTDSGNYILTALVGNRPYCPRCEIFVREALGQHAVNGMRPNFVGTTFGNQWDLTALREGAPPEIVNRHRLIQLAYLLTFSACHPNRDPLP